MTNHYRLLPLMVAAILGAGAVAGVLRRAIKRVKR